MKQNPDDKEIIGAAKYRAKGNLPWPLNDLQGLCHFTGNALYS